MGMMQKDSFVTDASDNGIAGMIVGTIDPPVFRFMINLCGFQSWIIHLHTVLIRCRSFVAIWSTGVAFALVNFPMFFDNGMAHNRRQATDKISVSQRSSMSDRKQNE